MRPAYGRTDSVAVADPPAGPASSGDLILQIGNEAGLAEQSDDADLIEIEHQGVVLGLVLRRRGA